MSDPGQGRGEADSSSGAPERRRAVLLLAVGAGLGILLAAVGLLGPSGGDGALPEGAVAVVNGEAIRRSDYERLLSGLESESRNPIDDATRRRVLDRMIEEELLVQRALQLGLVRVDRRVRADLTSSLIDSVVSSAEEREPEPQELREFYLEQRGFFTRPGRLRVRQVFFRVPDASREEEARARADAALAEIALGRDLGEVARELGDDEVAPVPNVLLPALKLREYIGPTALRSVMELEVGQVSPPVRSGSGVHLLELAAREPPQTPELAEIESQVRAEWRRRTGDRALRAYLDELRADSDVVTIPQI